MPQEVLKQKRLYNFSPSLAKFLVTGLGLFRQDQDQFPKITKKERTQEMLGRTVG